MVRFTFGTIFNSMPESLVIGLRIYNLLIGILNISGNAVLIWALQRTGQTKTISFQTITVMSASDLIIGITGLVFLSLITSRHFQASRLLDTVANLTLLTCNSFSLLMILLIALDRYLHMRFLERYSTIFTKKRGYFLICISLVFAISLSISATLVVPHVIYTILQSLYFLFTTFILVSVLILYHKALRLLRKKAHQITRSIINHNRALGTAAKRVSICILTLTVPLLVILIVDSANMSQKFVDESVIQAFAWISYVTFLGNGFCSSVIFISQNMPIRNLLRRVLRYNWNRIQSMFGTIENNV